MKKEIKKIKAIDFDFDCEVKVSASFGCPFCGGIIFIEIEDEGRMRDTDYCHNCDAEVEYQLYVSVDIDGQADVTRTLNVEEEITAGPNQINLFTGLTLEDERA